MLRPRNNVLIIEKEEDQNITKGGIHRIRIDKKQASIGKVIAIGPGGTDEDGKHHPVGVKVGDRIAYDLNGQKTIQLNHKDVVMLKAEFVFGILPA